MKPRHLPSNCLLRVYDELFACYCVEKFFPGSGRYAEIVASLHIRYPASRYGAGVTEEIEELAEHTIRWAAEICCQFRELRTMLVRFPPQYRRRRSAWALLKDAICFSSFQISRKNVLITELNKLQRRLGKRTAQDPADLLSELFLRHHSRLLARELHLRINETLLRSVDQVLRAEMLTPPS